MTVLIIFGHFCLDIIGFNDLSKTDKHNDEFSLRLQNDLFSLKSYKNNNKDNNLSGYNENKNKYKPLNNNNNNDGVRGKLNNIASLVDVDMNKIDKTDAHFIPKYKQIKTT